MEAPPKPRAQIESAGKALKSKKLESLQEPYFRSESPTGLVK